MCIIPDYTGVQQRLYTTVYRTTDHTGAQQGCTLQCTEQLTIRAYIRGCTLQCTELLTSTGVQLRLYTTVYRTTGVQQRLYTTVYRTNDDTCCGSHSYEDTIYRDRISEHTGLLKTTGRGRIPENTMVEIVS
jgi:hypothetical protein